MITRVKGNLLDYPSKGYFIVHQCNCSSGYVLGLAQQIYKKFPEADTRGCQFDLELFGTYSVVGAVVNLFAQRFPGEPRKFVQADRIDHASARLSAFNQSFRQFLFDVSPGGVALPWQIGCGMAKGNWKQYLELIEDIAKDFPNTKFIFVQQ